MISLGVGRVKEPEASGEEGIDDQASGFLAAYEIEKGKNYPVGWNDLPRLFSWAEAK